MAAITKRVLCRSVSRFFFVVGAGAMAAYAAYDTQQVAASAMEVFGGTNADESPTPPQPVPLALSLQYLRTLPPTRPSDR